MDYPVIDPAGTGANIRKLIRNNGKTVTETAGFLGLADKSTMYKLMNLLENTNSRKWLIYCIKIINRLK